MPLNIQRIANSEYRVASSSISNKRCGTAILINDSLKVNKAIKDDTGRFVQALVDFRDDQLKCPCDKKSLIQFETHQNSISR